MQRLTVIVILVMLFLAACGNDYKLQPLPDDAVILAFGDSLTYGTGASKATSYPSVLADLTDLRVVNKGVAGEQTAQGLARLPSVLAEYQPDLLPDLQGNKRIKSDTVHFSAEGYAQLAQGIH